MWTVTDEVDRGLKVDGSKISNRTIQKKWTLHKYHQSSVDTRVRGLSVSANFEKFYVRVRVRVRHFKLFHVHVRVCPHYK